jgi:hypothetical protein
MLDLSTAVLCDFAQVRDRLLFVASGAVSRLYRRELPSPLGLMVGLVIEVPLEDAGMEHGLRAEVINRHGTVLATLQNTFRVSDEGLFPHEVQQVPLVLSITGVRARTWGTHQVRLYLDEELVRALTLYVVPAAGTQVAAPAEAPAQAEGAGSEPVANTPPPPSPRPLADPDAELDDLLLSAPSDGDETVPDDATGDSVTSRFFEFGDLDLNDLEFDDDDTDTDTDEPTDTADPYADDDRESLDDVPDDDGPTGHEADPLDAPAPAEPAAAEEALLADEESPVLPVHEDPEPNWPAPAPTAVINAEPAATDDDHTVVRPFDFDEDDLDADPSQRPAPEPEPSAGEEKSRFAFRYRDDE